MVFAFLLALLLSVSLSFAVSGSAYASEVDPQTQAALQELEQAFSEAYAASQGEDGATADMASPLRSTPKVSTSEESITDEDTPLAAYPEAVEEIPDDENPLAASPYAAFVHDFAWVLLGIIMVVAAAFLVFTRRLNKNISQMRRFVD
ncbi:MAG: hypothetical protein Q4D27_09780 [Coriobacteriia bacterium]|nr:hypothetical protein [Coriobacteriia bacterium]